MSIDLTKEQKAHIQNTIREHIGAGRTFIPGSLRALFLVMLGIGVATAAAGLAGFGEQRVWLAIHTNTIFWSGLSFIGVLFTALMQLTRGVWGRHLKRLSEALAAFLPISLVLFATLQFGAEHIFPWVNNPAKEHWLNLPRVFGMNLTSIGVLYLLGFILLYRSIRLDTGVARDRYSFYVTDFAKLFIRNWKGVQAETERNQKILGFISPMIAILYALVFTFVAFDFIMSLDPYWYSTLFGGYFFATSFYLGLGLIATLGHFARLKYGLSEVLPDRIFHDAGKLFFAFCLVAAYFFWSQYKIIWYGNLPEEIPFVMMRFHYAPWCYLSYTAMAMVFFIPFLSLIPRKNKINSNTFPLIYSVVFLGIYLDRFIQVYPSIYGRSLQIGLWEVGVSLGFFGLFFTVYALFLSQFPFFAVGDPMVRSQHEGVYDWDVDEWMQDLSYEREVRSEA